MKQFITKDSAGMIMRNTPIRSFLVWGLISLYPQTTAHAQTTGPFSTKPVTIEGEGRALEDVLSHVQEAFRFPIYYEELPLESTRDLIVVNEPGLKQGLASPVSKLTVTLSDLDSTPYLAVETVLAAYTHAGYPGTYKVIPHDHRIDVLPAQIQSSGGSKRDVTPILSVPITFPIAKRTVADTLQLILEIASKESGYRVLIVQAPALQFQTVELGATGETLGDVFESLSAALSTVYSVSFRYVADEKTYYFAAGGVHRLLLQEHSQFEVIKQHRFCKFGQSCSGEFKLSILK